MYKMNLNEYFSAVRNGDKEAFAQIYDELEKPVFTIVSRIVQSKEIAEDVTQDIFVKLFVSPPDSSVKNPRAWIFQMTRNFAINALKKKQGIRLQFLCRNVRKSYRDTAFLSHTMHPDYEDWPLSENIALRPHPADALRRWWCFQQRSRDRQCHCRRDRRELPFLSDSKSYRVSIRLR